MADLALLLVVFLVVFAVDFLQKYSVEPAAMLPAAAVATPPAVMFPAGVVALAAMFLVALAAMFPVALAAMFPAATPPAAAVRAFHLDSAHLLRSKAVSAVLGSIP